MGTLEEVLVEKIAQQYWRLGSLLSMHILPFNEFGTRSERQQGCSFAVSDTPTAQTSFQPRHPTISHLRIVRKVHAQLPAQRSGKHPVHALEQRFVEFDQEEFCAGMDC